MEPDEMEVAYEGPAVDTGEMDVRQLAPALLAVGELITHANEIMNGDRATVSVKVSADFGNQSFDVFLHVHQHFLSKISMEDIKKAEELLKLLGLTAGTVAGGVFGVVKLLKALKGRAPKSRKKLDDGSISLSIEGDGNQVLIVTPDVARLAADRRIRQDMSRVLAPLRAEGIDAVRFGAKTAGVRISKGEADYFEPPTEAPSVLYNNESRLPLRLIGLFLEGDRKWTFSNGQTKFNAEITDESFLSRVHRGEEVFVAGDVLEVSLLTRTEERPDGSLRTKLEVKEVFDVRHPAREVDGHLFADAADPERKED